MKNLSKCSPLEQLAELTSDVVEELVKWTSAVVEELEGSAPDGGPWKGKSPKVSKFVEKI